MEQPAVPTPDVDISQAHPARVYDYWLGGKDNYAVDRELGDAMTAEMPNLPTMARAHRRFLERTVRYLAAEAGMSQFLHVAAGLPTTYNLHQVAQEIDPAARVVYVDSDPVVAAHSRALLVSGPKGAVAFVPGDVGNLPAVLGDPELAATLDLDVPIAVGLSSTLMRYSDGEARDILDALIAVLPVGSHLTLSHPTADFAPGATARAIAIGERADFGHTTRTHAQFSALFAGLELVDPGVVPILAWRPDVDGPRRAERGVHVLGAVARKP